jgi:hypothetical protein
MSVPGGMWGVACYSSHPIGCRLGTLVATQLRSRLRVSDLGELAHRIQDSVNDRGCWVKALRPRSLEFRIRNFVWQWRKSQGDSVEKKTPQPSLEGLRRFCITYA